MSERAEGHAANPARWCPDPLGRHQHRYWDGERWTSAVADGGIRSEDPTDADAPGAPAEADQASIDLQPVHAETEEPPAEPQPVVKEAHAEVVADDPVPGDAEPVEVDDREKEPDWYPDPTGRHEHRYWGGSVWTENVSDAGVASDDVRGQRKLDTTPRPKLTERAASKSKGLAARVKDTTGRAVELVREKERQHAANQARRRWQFERDTKRALLDRLLYEGSDNVPFVLQPGERAFFTMSPVGLVESRQGPSQYAGRSIGATRNVGLLGLRGSVSVGNSEGQITQGAEAPTQIDSGTAVVTNQQVVFQGRLHTRAWAFSKLVALSQMSGTLMIGVSDRDTTSGLALGPVYQDFKNWLDVAMCNFRGEIETERTRVESELAQLETHPPELMG
jgi:Protein of unknown function (DUF2510)